MGPKQGKGVKGPLKEARRVAEWVHVCRTAPSPTSRATALVSLVGRRSWVVDRVVGRSRGVDARRAGQLSLRARVQQLLSRSRRAITAENVAT